MGSGEEPGPLAVGAGEGALLVPEQLRFQEGLGHGGAVDGHEGPGPTRARPVQRASDQLLAGAALAEQEHGSVAVRHRAHLLEHRLHRARPAYYALEAELPLDLRPQPRVLLPQPLVVDGAAHRVGDLGELEGLGEIVVRALAHGLDGGLEAAERGHQEHSRRGGPRLGGSEHLDPADVVHDQVGEDHVVVARPRWR